MRTYAQKRQQSQPGHSRYISRPNNAAINNRQAHRALQLQPTMGNQARQRTLLSGAAAPLVNDVLRSSGHPLPLQTRSFMEARFGQDFSQVRIHNDATAAESARAVNARAYTVGQHIALGAGEYAPQTTEGKRLLAHELTHVLHQTAGGKPGRMLQRQTTGKTKPANRFSVSLTGCGESPFTEDFIRASAREAFDTANEGDCIKNETLKQEILSKFDGLEIVCSQDTPPGSCGERVTSSKFIIFKTAFNSNKCPRMAATIFHESVHLIQTRFLSRHGELSWDCQESCFPGSDEPGRGTASGCDLERGAVRAQSISFGRAFIDPTDPKTSTKYLRLFYGYEKRRWLASYLDFSAGIGVTFLGETERGEPREISSSSTMINLIASLRLDPGSQGGPYFGGSGGLGVATSGSNQEFGKEVAVVAGVRWHPIDISVNIGVDFDPTRKTGMDKLFFAAATLTFTPKY